jgi:hypothetical protein
MPIDSLGSIELSSTEVERFSADQELETNRFFFLNLSISCVVKKNDPWSDVYEACEVCDDAVGCEDCIRAD